MKVIDLYIKHANGEDLPEKIEIGNNVFKLNETGDIYYTGVYNDIPLSMEWDLNDEVKIIEEEKEIEKIPYCYSFGFIDCGGLSDVARDELDKNFNYFKDKINELIDAVNEIRKEK